MGIGLIGDLAVGVDSGGSQCWSRQHETLLGLTVGAPPDLLQRHGQNWGLTAFSPTGLTESGFRTFREMLTAALMHSGGLRIDHAMGLNRLWVIPDGGSGADGAYLRFPENDLLALIKLKSTRHKAIILAEDLGTVPDGFQERLTNGGIEGMRVLWFERDGTGDFISPKLWSRCAAAMTSTHDLPTLAGWWRSRDLEWNKEIGRIADPSEIEQERSHDKVALWAAFQNSGAADPAVPPPDDAGEFADAAMRHVGSSACEQVIVPMEDALALIEQPNLPGTTIEHPNWRRRLPAETPEDSSQEKWLSVYAGWTRLGIIRDCRSREAFSCHRSPPVPQAIYVG